MQFTDAEIRFLCTEHQTFFEYANSNRTTTRANLRGMGDLRELGCPEHIFFSILERRAKQLGGKFTEFRARQAGTTNSNDEYGDALRREKFLLTIAEVAADLR